MITGQDDEDEDDYVTQTRRRRKNRWKKQALVRKREKRTTVVRWAKDRKGKEGNSLSFARYSPCFPTRGIHFKDRRNISIGCKGDSRQRFSAGQLAKGCTKSCPDISRVYQSQCGSGVPDTQPLFSRSAERRENERDAGRGRETKRTREESGEERKGEERDAGCGRRCCRCTRRRVHPVPSLRSHRYVSTVTGTTATRVSRIRVTITFRSRDQKRYRGEKIL